MLQFFNFLHFVGLAWGVGGVTAAAIISMKAEKDPKLGPASLELLSGISKMIWAGLILLIISGIGVARYVAWPLDARVLAIKHVLVVLIVVIALLIMSTLKKLKSLAPKPNSKPSPGFLEVKKRMKLFSMINLVLWYLVVVLAVFV